MKYLEYLFNRVYDLFYFTAHKAMKINILLVTSPLLKIFIFMTTREKNLIIHSNHNKYAL